MDNRPIRFNKNGKYNLDFIDWNNEWERVGEVACRIENGEELSDKEEEAIQFLPCREVEQKRIYNYIKEGLQTNGAYSSLYIAGLPGTGKTASVLTVLKMLEQEAKQKKISTFNELYINGMKFTNPSNVFKTIYNFIFEDQKNQNIKKYYIRKH